MELSLFIELSAEMFIGTDPSIVFLAGPITVQNNYKQCMAAILKGALCPEGAPL